MNSIASVSSTPRLPTSQTSRHSTTEMGATSLRVAIVEGDPCQAEVFTQWLKLAGHCCHHFAHGEALLRLFDQVSIDALLLDWNLPRLGSVDVLKQIRRSDRASLPVLLVSGRSDEDDIVSALRQGADDYLIKPVRRLELIARLEAIARRGKYRVEPSASFEVGALHVDCQSRTLLRRGREVEMTAKDLELSLLLLRNVGRLLSRGYLLDSVWGSRGSIESRTLDTHISRVRGKLGLTPENGWRLAAKYGRGYRLDHLSSADN